jgi:hypothetical protein
MGKRIEDPNFLVQHGPLKSMGQTKEKITSVKVDKTKMTIPQAERIEDEFYLNLVRSLPSIVSGFGPCIVHHLRLSGHDGGMAMKPGDNHVVPMLDAEHKILHSPKMGDKRYWDFTGIDARLCAAWLYESYLGGWSYERAVEIIRQCQPKDGI